MVSLLTPRPSADAPNGAVLYRGPSRIDGAPIALIATGLAESSRNTKTGQMIQTWIMREDIPPHVAVRSGEASSVCGDCPSQPATDAQRDAGDETAGSGACYVLVFQAPRNVWETYHRGRYIDATQASDDDVARIFESKTFRLGSYGNPSAVPARGPNSLLAGPCFALRSEFFAQNTVGSKPNCHAPPVHHSPRKGGQSWTRRPSAAPWPSPPSAPGSPPFVCHLAAQTAQSAQSWACSKLCVAQARSVSPTRLDSHGRTPRAAPARMLRSATVPPCSECVRSTVRATAIRSAAIRATPCQCRRHKFPYVGASQPRAPTLRRKT